MSHITAGDISPLYETTEPTYTHNAGGVTSYYADLKGDSGSFTPTDNPNMNVAWRHDSRAFNMADNVPTCLDAGYSDVLEARDAEGWEKIIKYAIGDSGTTAGTPRLKSRSTELLMTESSGREGLIYRGCKTDRLEIRADQPGGIVEFDEKPLQAKTNLVSCGIYVVRRRFLIEMIELSAQEERYDFVRDILMRYKDVKKFCGYNMKEYWRNIASVEDYFGTNMDFLKPEVRDYFFRQYPDIYSKVDDLPPAKYNYGASVRNSLISSGCIVNGVVEDSVVFKKSYIGNNCVIKNSIILNDVYIGDDCYIENCIVESRDTIKAGSRYVGEDGKIRIVLERNDRYDM